MVSLLDYEVFEISLSKRTLLGKLLLSGRLGAGPSGLGGPEAPTRATGSFVYECATQVLILFRFLTIDYV
jgi:hypothetical protein